MKIEVSCVQERGTRLSRVVATKFDSSKHASNFINRRIKSTNSFGSDGQKFAKSQVNFSCRNSANFVGFCIVPDEQGSLNYHGCAFWANRLRSPSALANFFVSNS